MVAVTFVAEGAPGDAVEVGVSPLAELASLLHALADPAHHQPAGPMLERSRASLSEDDRAEAEKLSPLWSGYRARFLFPAEAGLGRGFAEELTLLESYPADRFFEGAAWAIRGGYTGAPPIAEMVCDGRARRDLLARASARSSDALVLMRQLLEDPDALRKRVVSFLDRCDAAFFSVEWASLRPVLEADATSRQVLAERAGPLATIASLSRSAQVLGAPSRVRFEKVHHGRIDLSRGRVMLVPSATAWPHLLVKHEPGWPALVHYPFRDVSPAHTSPPVAEVQHRLEALTDPTRLRLCRLIGQSPSTTSDLAARISMSAPQVSRHLRALREVGLVERSRDGRRVRYHLCQEQVARLGIDLLAALLR